MAFEQFNWSSDKASTDKKQAALGDQMRFAVAKRIANNDIQKFKINKVPGPLRSPDRKF